jgi:hypothetical protein
MLKEKEIKHALNLQERSYNLLLWMADAVTKGFIEFNTAHEYSSLPEATTEWILIHYKNIPDNARVEKKDLHQFSAFFSTYLENSFNLIEEPGKQLFSIDAHCFCPLCSWLINSPNLKTKKPTSTDKRRAKKMKTSAVKEISMENELSLNTDQIKEIVENSEFREELSLAAYARDLLIRVNGIAMGPAVLVLWRGFAWRKEGSPKHNFKLTPELIFENEQKLIKILKKYKNKNA